MSINQWPDTERPREKLLLSGARSLSDAELLAIFLGTGVQGRSAVGLGRTLLNRFGSINGLISAPFREFRQTRGAGAAKFSRLQAAAELGRRANLETLQSVDALSRPQLTREYLKSLLAGEPRELFWCLFLNNRNQIIASEALSLGTIDRTSVYPREVVRACIAHNAAAVIFAHNHPSGRAEPSRADQVITQRLKSALALIDVRTLDHFVVSEQKVVSMAEMDLL